MKKIDPYLIPDTPLNTTGVAFIHISSGFRGGYVIENNSGELIVHSIKNITKSNLDIYYLNTYNKKFIYCYETRIRMNMIEGEKMNKITLPQGFLRDEIEISTNN